MDSPGNHRSDGNQAGHALTFKPDHSMGADHADFVKLNSGFSIGGVAPVGHRVPPIVILDHHLRNLDTIWAAAGTPNSVFCLTPEQLVDLTGGSFEEISE